MYTKTMNRGSMTIETAFLLPVILLLAFSLFFFPIRLYQKAALYAYAFDQGLERPADYVGRVDSAVSRVAGREVTCDRVVGTEAVYVTLHVGRRDFSLCINRAEGGRLVWIRS